METKTVSVIAPIYNEAENLRPLVSAICRSLDAHDLDYEIILVDDGSTDGSRDILREISTEYPVVRSIFFRRNYGQTAAMDAGFAASRGEVVCPIDADLQNDPDDIPMLVAKLDEGWDIVSGWRKDREDATVRVIPSKIANWLVSTVGGVPLHDTGCTLKAYRRSVTDELRLYGDMHRFLPIYGAMVGARVTEVPVKHHARRAGVSKYGYSRIIKVIPDMLWIGYQRKFATKPMQLFGGIGIGTIGASKLLSFAALSSAGTKRKTGNLWIASLILGCVGLVSLLLGINAETGLRTRYESSGKRPYLIAEEFGGQPLGDDQAATP
jgi:glycosyltransferase involved in cell wall biosynthesis